LGLEVLYGEHAGDSIDFCLAEICRESYRWPEKRAYLIVPEQTKADMERRYLEIRNRLCDRSCPTPPESKNALMLVDVVSFSRFAHRILSEGKSDFKVLSALADRIGFVPEVQSVLGDFLRYHVTPESMRSLDSASLDPSFLTKISDFALLMERLAGKTEELGYCAQGQELLRLTETLEILAQGGREASVWPLNRLSYLRDTSVWILGFGETRDFTPQESTVIEGLVRLTAKTIITVAADRVPSGRISIADGSRAFRFGRQTLWNLLQKFPGAGIRKIPESDRRHPSLMHLSGAFAERNTSVYEGDSSPIHMVSFRNSMEELSYTAGEIKRLVLTEGYRYGEISVVLCNPAACESDLHAVFAEYGLDPFLDKRRPLSGTVLFRFVLSMLDLGVNGWSFGPLMTCLKSGMCHIASDDADLLENYCLAHGLFKGYRIFSESSYGEKKDPGGRMASLVKRVLLPIRNFLDAMASASTCSGKAGLLLDFLDTYGPSGEDSPLRGMASQIDSLSREWADAGDQDAALALVLSFRELTALLKSLEGPIGETPMNLLNFRSMLSSGMEASFSGAIPSYVDQIEITDARRGAMKNCRALFLLGASRKVFPFQTVKEGYFRGYERELLSSNLNIPFPSRSRDQAYADFYTAYSLLDCPGDRFYISCPKTEEPSSVLDFIRTVFPECRRIENGPMSVHDPRLFSRSAMRRFVQAGLAGNVEGIGGKELAPMLALFPELKSERDDSQGTFSVLIPEDILNRRYCMAERMSVSQIESYAECPFMHFSRYVLNLKPRDVCRSASNLVGSILHTILEKSLAAYSEESRAAGTPEKKADVYREYLSRDYRSMAKSILRDIVAESGEASLKDPAYRVVADPGFLANDGNRILNVASHSLRTLFRGISPEGFEPEYMEWTFGGEDDSYLTTALPTGRTIRFRGTIDRVDLDRAANTFRVIDYKSGNKSVDYTKLYHGLSVQLPAYLFAYQASHPDAAPAEAGYFHLTAPMISLGSLSGKPEADKLSGLIEKEYRLRTLNVDRDLLPLAGRHAMAKIEEHCTNLFNGDFSVTPRLLPEKTAKPACTFCDYIAVCGIDPANPPCLRLRELPLTGTPDMKRPRKNKLFEELLRTEFPEKDGNET
jgi:ATP-dependent helicase/nuclease subunit B